MHQHEQDDDDVLAWAAAADSARHDHTRHDHHHHHHGREEEDDDEDDDTFALLQLPAASHETSEQHDDDEHDREEEDEEEQSPAPPPRLQQQQQQHQQQHSHRFKRKNFSKQLQLLSLQRYAFFAREQARLPDKRECQRLLQQSYAQFLAAGGAPDEPQLSPPDFLKLIRNRRREMHARAHQLRSNSSVSSSSSSTSSSSAEARPRTAAKRKLQQEHARIYALIEAIDQARERPGLSTPPPHEIPVQRSSKRHAKAVSPTAAAAAAAPQLRQPPPPSPPAPMDPQEQIRAIFRLQHETLDVQREIAQRLKGIRLHRGLQAEHDDALEPSSASV